LKDNKNPSTVEEWRELYPLRKNQTLKHSARFQDLLNNNLIDDLKNVKSMQEIEFIGWQSVLSASSAATVENGKYAMSRLVDFWIWCTTHIHDWEEKFPQPHQPKTVQVLQVFLIWCYMCMKYSISTINNTFKSGLSLHFCRQGWSHINWDLWTPSLNRTCAALLMKFGHVKYKVTPVLNIYLNKMLAISNLNDESDCKRLAEVMQTRY
jgi:hypothetical protein